MNRARVAVGLVAVAALMIGWAMLREAALLEPESMAPAAGPAPSSPATGADIASAAASTAADLTSTANDEVQVCGGAWLQAGADGQVRAEDAAAFRRRMLDASKTPALAFMEASADARTQAAAVLVRIADDRAPPVCDSDEACVGAAEQGRQAAETHRAALARLAQESTDAQVYGWAYRACHVGAANSESACQLLTAQQWARLDPANAAPWLSMAAEAEALGDASAVDDAMFHVASAERQDHGLGALPAQLIDHAPPGDPYLVGTVALAIEGLGIDAAATVPDLTATTYCNVKNLADANRRETCERIAGLFLDRSNTLAEGDIGLVLAKRLGWPAARIGAIAEERNALHETSAREFSAIELVTSCKDLHHQLDRIRDVADHGELVSMRRTIAAANRTVLPLVAARQREPAEPSSRAGSDAAAAASALADRSEN